MIFKVKDQLYETIEKNAKIKIDIGVSVGYSIYPYDGKSLDELIH